MRYRYQPPYYSKSKPRQYKTQCKHNKCPAPLWVNQCRENILQESNTSLCNSLLCNIAFAVDKQQFNVLICHISSSQLHRLLTHFLEQPDVEFFDSCPVGSFDFCKFKLQKNNEKKREVNEYQSMSGRAVVTECLCVYVWVCCIQNIYNKSSSSLSNIISNA